MASRACAVVERDYEPIHVAIDCGYSQDSARALHSVGKQLSMIVGTNRRARRPARLHATSFAGDVAASVRQKHAIDAWQDMDTHADAFTEVPELLDAAGGDLRNFVYMSPDGEEVLNGEVESGVVYVFAGLIDVNPPTPNISRARAEALGVRTARLPVREFYPGASATVMVRAPPRPQATRRHTQSGLGADPDAAVCARASTHTAVDRERGGVRAHETDDRQLGGGHGDRGAEPDKGGAQNPLQAQERRGVVPLD